MNMVWWLRQDSPLSSHKQFAQDEKNLQVLSNGNCTTYFHFRWVGLGQAYRTFLIKNPLFPSTTFQELEKVWKPQNPIEFNQVQNVFERFVQVFQSGYWQRDYLYELSQGLKWWQGHPTMEHFSQEVTKPKVKLTPPSYLRPLHVEYFFFWKRFQSIWQDNPSFPLS